MTAEQRAALETLKSEISTIQNFCNRAEGYLSDAEQEPANDRVDILIRDARDLVNQCKE